MGELEVIEGLLTRGINWIRMFVPDQALTLREEPDPVIVGKLGEGEKRALGELARAIRERPDPDSIQTAVFSTAKDNGMKPGRLFQILYGLVLGQRSGPRLGPLVAAMGSGKIADLIEAAGRA
jgi:lysyl-tRNA synthetase class 1